VSAWSPKKFAASCGIDANEIERLIDAGQIRAFSLGPRTWRIVPEEADRVRPLLGSDVPLPIVSCGRNRIPQRPSKIPDREIVYFVDCGAFTKIGFTLGQFSSRLAGMLTDNPFDIELWAVISGGRTLEAQLHEEFAAYKHRLEWFRFDRNARLAVIKRVQALGGRIVKRRRRGE